MNDMLLRICEIMFILVCLATLIFYWALIGLFRVVRRFIRFINKWLF